jgi:hypothetical protein
MDVITVLLSIAFIAWVVIDALKIDLTVSTTHRPAPRRRHRPF